MASERIAEGRRILVVEDEMSIVAMIEETLLELGAEVVGPTAWLDAALPLAQEAPIDAAVLDVNIRGGRSYPTADILAERGVSGGAKVGQWSGGAVPLRGGVKVGHWLG